jgi:hypothetical protein
MRQLGAEAHDVALSLADRPLTAAAHAVICLAVTYGGRMDEAQRHATEARLLVDALDDNELAGRLDAATARRTPRSPRSCS